MRNVLVNNDKAGSGAGRLAMQTLGTPRLGVKAWPEHIPAAGVWGS